jgi:hypothetical protein
MDIPREPTSPRDLIVALGQHPQVVGVVEYGSRRHEDEHANGDVDLVVVLDAADPGTGTIHGWVGAIPVDLGIVTESQLGSRRALVGWERVLLEGRIVRDTDGRVEALLQRLRRSAIDRGVPGPATVAGMRHGARHALLKAEAASKRADVLLARLLLSSAAAWLVQHWFTARGHDFPGERRALEILREESPEVIDALERVLRDQDTRRALAACERLAQLTLEPVGGPWRNGEVIARDPQTGAPDAEQVWNRLLSGDRLPTAERPFPT